MKNIISLRNNLVTTFLDDLMIRVTLLLNIDLDETENIVKVISDISLWICFNTLNHILNSFQCCHRMCIISCKYTFHKKGRLTKERKQWWHKYLLRVFQVARVEFQHEISKLKRLHLGEPHMLNWNFTIYNLQTWDWGGDSSAKSSNFSSRGQLLKDTSGFSHWKCSLGDYRLFTHVLATSCVQVVITFKKHPRMNLQAELNLWLNELKGLLT